MEFSRLNLMKLGQIATITITNPPANVLDQQLFLELGQVLGQCNEDYTVRVIIVTGEGKMFVAGADIKALASVPSAEVGIALARQGQQLFHQIEQLEKPVIAMINGACLGGGLELAMACHLRIAADSAKLGLPELRLGLIPGYGGTQRLPRLVGRSKATELILTSALIDGTEAERIGLVSRAVPLTELELAVHTLAETICERSPLSIVAALVAIDQGCMSDEKGYQVEREGFGGLLESSDAHEGMKAFLEKRSPHFRGC